MPHGRLLGSCEPHPQRVPKMACEEQLILHPRLSTHQRWLGQRRLLREKHRKAAASLLGGRW